MERPSPLYIILDRPSEWMSGIGAEHNDALGKKMKFLKGKL